MFGNKHLAAGWSSPVARQAHNLKVAGSNPAPATKLSCKINWSSESLTLFFCPIMLAHS
jgi:hypothetical protein